MSWAGSTQGDQDRCRRRFSSDWFQEGLKCYWLPVGSKRGPTGVGEGGPGLRDRLNSHSFIHERTVVGSCSHAGTTTNPHLEDWNGNVWMAVVLACVCKGTSLLFDSCPAGNTGNNVDTFHIPCASYRCHEGCCRVEGAREMDMNSPQCCHDNWTALSQGNLRESQEVQTAYICI